MIDISTIDWPQLITWIIIAIVALWLLRFLFSIIRWVILGLAAVVSLTLIADKLQGGTAFNQIADMILNWVRGIGK